MELFTLTNPAATLPSFDEASPQRAYQELAGCPVSVARKKVLSKREDVVEFTRHPAVKANDGVNFQLGASEALIPLMIDGPEHHTYRRLLNPLFSPKAIARLRPSIERMTNDAIDAFIDAGQTELFSSFCQALPTQVFLDLMGLPQDDVPMFFRFKDAMIRPEGATREEQDAFQAREGQTMRDYLDGVFDARLASGELGDDLIGGFLTAEIEGRTLTRSEIMRIVYLLVIAGLDTVSAALSCMFQWLAQHPVERAQLVADPSLIPNAIEELLRYESPVMYGSRYVSEDFTLGDREFSAGEWVDVMWSSANVDPDVFEDALTVDLTRNANAQIGFASGPHRCLGSNLARLELATALEQFHKRIPDYEITPGQEILFFNIGVRAAVVLPISFPAGGGAAA